MRACDSECKRPQKSALVSVSCVMRSACCGSGAQSFNISSEPDFNAISSSELVLTLRAGTVVEAAQTCEQSLSSRVEAAKTREQSLSSRVLISVRERVTLLFNLGTVRVQASGQGEETRI